jgi:spoIIIJ-associated protein
MVLSEIQSDTTPETTEQISKRAQEFLLGVLERMNIEAQISVSEEDDKIVLDIECDDVEQVIGRRGQVVDALQHLVGKAVSKERPGRRGKMVIVDAGGYRAKHIERLEELAERMSDKALSTDNVVALNPMSAHDRRIVHMRIANIAGVTTRSEGSGDRRHVLIVLDSETAADEADVEAGEETAEAGEETADE